MLLDEEMLQSSNVRILRRQLDRLAKRHHTINRLLGFVQCLVRFSRLVFKTKGLLKERLHLADGVAAQHRNFEAFFFEILERP